MCSRGACGLEIIHVSPWGSVYFDFTAPITFISTLSNGIVIANVVGSGIQLLKSRQGILPTITSSFTCTNYALPRQGQNHCRHTNQLGPHHVIGNSHDVTSPNDPIPEESVGSHWLDHCPLYNTWTKDLNSLLCKSRQKLPVVVDSIDQYLQWTIHIDDLLYAVASHQLVSG